MMRLLLCWADISGYMAACWRALAERPEVELQVIAFEAGPKSFANELVKGINCRVLTPQEKNDATLIRSLVKEARPDVLYISGWFHPPYRSLLTDSEFASIPKWMGSDTPWQGNWRQQLARVALRKLLRRVDRALVPGERAWQYMRALGFSDDRISRGLYGVDYAALAPIYDRRAAGGNWPKRFLFTGRYVHEKGIDVLVDAYRRYRAAVSDSWPLTCCGRGPMLNLLAGQEGIEDLGFVQPPDIRAVTARSGAFVLASRFDPWPLVVVESCAAGLPVICTEACGSSVELVRGHYNGLTVATGDAEAMFRGMIWAHERHAQLPEFGRRAQSFAAAYSAQAWAQRWVALLGASA